MNNKIITIIPSLLILLAIFVTVPSCSHSTPSFVEKSIVQVWKPDLNGGAEVLEALGVAVGDGTTVLTVINYVDYSPGELAVVSTEHGKFIATIQSIDSRTGATILKLGSGRLPTVTTRDATTLKAGDKLIVWGQDHADSTLRPTEVLLQVINSNSSTLEFNVILADSTLNKGGYDGVQAQGAVVTDQSGKVLGLESVLTNRLVINVGGPGEIAPIITIHSALELLSTNSNNQPWANGPFLIAANEIGSRSGYYVGTVRDYVPVATAITQVLSELGGPLSTGDLPQDFTSYVLKNQITQSSDGSLLTTVFPHPVELHDSSGNVLAQAKWVGFQWYRNEGKPNRIVYGNIAYIVDGSFELTGDISSLENSVRTLLNDPTPYGQ